jgi:hypothetical protein
LENISHADTEALSDRILCGTPKAVPSSGESFRNSQGTFMVVQRLTSLPFSNRIDVEQVMAESEPSPNFSDLLRVTNSRYTCP